MSRLLVLGYLPPPLAGGIKVEAAHYRSWQFIEPLLADGHTLCLLVDADELARARVDLPEPWAARLTIRGIPFGQRGWIEAAQREHDSFTPDAIVAINFDASLYATRLNSDRPLWMDIYGDYLTIMQAKCYRAGSDRGLPTSIGFVRQILGRGDRFSVCGEPQRHFTAGQLSMVGRLGRRTFGYEFVEVVRPGAPATLQSPGDCGAVRERWGIPDDAFVLLWCGGYNTWTDVDTLFAALERAMASEPRLHYLSVGASTYDAPDNVYARFEGMVRRSPHRERYHLLGWRPWAEIPGYYDASDVGLNIDALHYETIYGTRTRLMEMMAAGLPVVTSLGSELSALLAARGASLTFDVGRADELAARLATLATEPARLAALRAAGAELVAGELSFATTTRPLLDWARAPVAAPDHAARGVRERLAAIEYRGRAALRQLIWTLTGEDE